ncbi:MAG: hypothetical protein PVH38_06455 [Gammaproteobacteria bacterium]|jgi:hypothetical protein
MDFIKWGFFFNSEGGIAENLRHEENKMSNYNRLVENLVILGNVEQHDEDRSKTEPRRP